MERDTDNDERRPEHGKQPNDQTTERLGLQRGQESFATAYARQMHEGDRQYAPVLHLLDDMGLTAFFTQTGGMNAAIEVTLESERYLLITDSEGSLPWQWAEHQDWAVGLYRLPVDEQDDATDPLRFETTDDGSPDGLVDLVRGVLGEQAEGAE